MEIVTEDEMDHYEWGVMPCCKRKGIGMKSLHISQNAEKLWVWVLKSENNKVMARSHKAFKNQASCRDNAMYVAQGLPKAYGQYVQKSLLNKWKEET